MLPTLLTPGSLNRLDEFDCHLWRYSPSLSRLLVKLLLGDAVEGESHYVMFRTVEFYSGAMAWKGAAFTLATRAEIFDIVARLRGERYAHEFASSDSMDGRKLFVFGDHAQILCHEALLYHEMPLDF